MKYIVFAKISTTAEKSFLFRDRSVKVISQDFLVLKRPLTFNVFNRP